MTRLRSTRTWTASSKMPCFLTLSTWQEIKGQLFKKEIKGPPLSITVILYKLQKVEQLARYWNVVSRVVLHESEVQTHPDDGCVVARVIVYHNSARSSTVGDEHSATSDSEDNLEKTYYYKQSSFGSWLEGQLYAQYCTSNKLVKHLEEAAKESMIPYSLC